MNLSTRVGQTKKNKDQSNAANEAKGRLLHVPLARLPHLEPFPADDEEAEKVERKADGQAGDGRPFGGIGRCGALCAEEAKGAENAQASA